MNDNLEGGVAGKLRKRKLKPSNLQQTQNAVLRQLMQGLKLCLNGAKSPEDLIHVAQTWLDEMQTQTHVQTDKPRKKRRIAARDALNLAQGTQTQTAHRHVWTFAIGSQRRYQVDPRSGWWWWDDPPSHLSGKQDGVQPRKSSTGADDISAHKTGQVAHRHQVPASGLRDCEWTVKPSFISLSKAMQIFKNGEQCNHNMIELRSIDESYHFCAIWNAFDRPGSVAIFLTGQAIGVVEATSTQKTIYGGKNGTAPALCVWTKAAMRISKEKSRLMKKSLSSSLLLWHTAESSSRITRIRPGLSLLMLPKLAKSKLEFSPQQTSCFQTWKQEWGTWDLLFSSSGAQN